MEKRGSKRKNRKKDLLRLAVILGVLALFAFAFGRTGSFQQGEEAALVRDSVRRATLTCYAVEGAYPENLAYLKENYGLFYNEERFHVTYQSFAWNQIPDIYVVERGATEP